MLLRTGEVVDQGRNKALCGEPSSTAAATTTTTTTISRCRAGTEALDTETKRLVTQVLGEHVGILKPRWNENEALSTMKRVVDHVLGKYSYVYNGMLDGLSLDDRGDDVTFVRAIAKSLFADGTVNWGRVVSLVAFGAALSEYLKDKGRESCVELVGEEIAVYMLTDQKDWMTENNSWHGFVEFFRPADRGSAVSNALMTIAGVAGIGATLTLLIM
ncbi:hypothetical protein UPYG_G00353150 [Umbra pygmaea]|uniref:Bcl-2 Bcl-2 homology region 1-3 domain-containing protein n=1 Tax=Umbra pygmaea TaxID=75934 RepID=A0ABD0WC05_UMBPY